MYSFTADGALPETKVIMTMEQQNEHLISESFILEIRTFEPMLLPLLDLAIVFHCLIFGVFFLLRKGGIGHTNFYLGVLLILLGLLSLQFALKPTGWIFDFPYLVDLEWAAGFLFVPIYIWYVREMTGEKIKFNWREAMHLVPGILAFVYFSKYYFKTREEQLEYLKLIQSTYIIDYEIGDALFYPYLQGSLIYCIVMLYRRQGQVTGIYLNNLRWLKTFTFIVLGFVFLGAAIYFLKLPQIYIDAFPLCSASVYFMLIYRFLQQSGSDFATLPPSLPKEQKPKYSGSNLSEEEADRLNTDLQNFMKEQQPYLNPNLTLQSLAQEIKTSSHYLSQVINQYHQKNFPDFINSFRIEAAKRMILENELLKLEAIGYECGFNTKSTFNHTFKKFTGLTPGEYRKKEAEKDVQIYKI